MIAESASIGDHNPQGVADVNTYVEKAPDSVVKVAGGAIFIWFYPNWYTRITQIDKELQTCPEVNCLSAHEWYPHNICFPEISRTVEEEISRNIGAVMTKGEHPDLTYTDSDRNSMDQIYYIGAMTSQMI